MLPVMTTKVLISGAGIAGPTLAYFLGRAGFHVTVVERAQGLRSSGSPVDVRGAAVEVAERMGVMAELREAATTAKTLTFVDAEGRRAARLSMRGPLLGSEVELPRGDLAAILHGAGRDDAEFLFDDTVVALTQDAGGVDVTFDRAAPRRFDLVIGADGLHSAVRRLAFGPESQFAEHMGVFVATLPLDAPADDPTDIVMFNTPGRAVTIHPCRGKALVAFMFRAPMPPGFDHRDVEMHQRMLVEAFDGQGWRVPELLAGVRGSDDLYFDSVSRVRLPRWSIGRIALLGDAASCVSLFGDGSSSAMTGAATLADALSTNDFPAALEDYEARHRRTVDPRLRNVGLASRLLVPATSGGIALRNFAARLLGGVRAASQAAS
jgi:2-polyprenyl-6-methoxyphenol hydroxylase-like FAD-dependent oxidoreductase